MNENRIIIIGGGISGLATAHRLQELLSAKNFPHKIILFEAGEQLGGLLKTYRQDDFVMEAGAESFITDKPWALDLCRRLDIAQELCETNPNERFSYVLHSGKLKSIPAGFYLTAPGKVLPFLKSDILSWGGKFRVLGELFIPSKMLDDESVGDFIRRRLGRECLEKIGQPMIGGIYGGDINKLSLKSTFPKFMEMERECGSIIRALLYQKKPESEKSGTAGPRYQLFMSFKKGMQTLIESLEARIASNVEIKTKTGIAKLEKLGSVWSVTDESGKVWDAGSVCLALPLKKSAQLVAPVSKKLSEQLLSIETTSAVTLNLVYDEKAFSKPLKGFGFVVPEAEHSPLIGCTFSSLKFPHRASAGRVLLRAFIAKNLFSLTDASIVEKAHGALSELLAIHQTPLKSVVTRYEDVMPQYHVGHQKKIIDVEQIKRKIPGLFFVGNGFSGVGIPDCVRYAEQEALLISEHLINLQKTKIGGAL